jgi:hypothetical protein
MSSSEGCFSAAFSEPFFFFSRLQKLFFSFAKTNFPPAQYLSNLSRVNCAVFRPPKMTETTGAEEEQTGEAERIV